MNLFLKLLQKLKVKHTTQYALNLYEGHPYRDTLYGLSEMLFIYNIENAAIELEDKNQISNLDTPFVAYISNDFVVVEKNNDKYIEFLWRNEKIKVPPEKFISIWSGIALIVETNEKSIEPYFGENRKRELINKGLNVSILMFFILFCSYSIFLSVLWQNGNWIILLEALTGICICYFILKKQLKIESVYAEKLCSIFKKNACNDVLNSDASKFLGFFSWGEIGFSYFISLLLILVFFSNWILYSAWINILILPYTFWSVWYQRCRVKQWCPLCLIVIGLIWIIFFSYSLFGENIISAFKYSDFFIVVSIYIFIFLIVHKEISIFSGYLLKNQIENEIKRIKLNENVFHSLLINNTYLSVSFNTSKIIFGNPQSQKLITIFTNPHCDPCSKIHKQIHDLLKETKDKYCIQYIFTSFNLSLDISCKMLIYAYLHNTKAKAIEIFDEWFDEGKYNKEIFFSKYNLNVNLAVEEEFNKHKKWGNRNKLHETPTIFVNGHMLPNQYNIEDLCFLEID